MFPTLERIKKILKLGLPIVGGMVSQNILNLIDTAMVGSLGDIALAAAGLGSFYIFMAQAMIMGLSSGVQTIVSRRVGEKRTAELGAPLNCAILISSFLGVLYTLLLQLLSPKIVTFLVSDPLVLTQAQSYIEIRLWAVAAVGINFSFRGFWNGLGHSKIYLKAILLVHICNIIFNYIFIFGHFGMNPMGVSGSALGTVLALYIGSLFYFIHSAHYSKSFQIYKELPSKKTLKDLVRISILSGLQTFFFALGFTVLFWIIGQIGTQELAAANVLINITLICVLPGVAFGIATATLAGQSLGQGDKREAIQWGWDVSKVSATCVAILGLPMLFFPEWILHLFIKDPSTIEIAALPLQLIGLGISFDSVGVVLLNAQIANGSASSVIRISIFLQWIIFLPCAYIIGPILQFGLTGIWTCQIIYRLLLSMSMAHHWKKARWAAAKI